MEGFWNSVSVRVESFRIGLKVLGFGGGFWVWGFEILVRAWGLGCWDSA